MKKTCKLTDQQKIEIVEKYKTGEYNCPQLGKEYEVTKGAILSLLHKRGVKIKSKSDIARKYSLNHNYFDVIDDEHKAYWLGFLYADGCNYTPNHQVILSLQSSDAEIIEKFKKDLSCDNPLQHIVRDNNKWKDIARLVVTSQHMSNKLESLGVVQAKTHILKFPTSEQVPEHLLRHWLRGLWDGDGSTTLRYREGVRSLDPRAYVAGTSEICLGIELFLSKEINVRALVRTPKNCINSNIRVLMVSGSQQYSRLMNLLYDGSTIHLQRKYEKYLDFKEKMFERGFVLKEPLIHYS
jgi:transposase-like protein